MEKEIIDKKNIELIREKLIENCQIIQMNKFNKVDLHETYFTIFPNMAAYIFCYINIVCFAALSILSAFRFFHKDVEDEEFKEEEANCSKLMVLIPYLAWMTFAGYLNIGIAVLNK